MKPGISLQELQAICLADLEVWLRQCPHFFGSRVSKNDALSSTHEIESLQPCKDVVRVLGMTEPLNFAEEKLCRNHAFVLHLALRLWVSTHNILWWWSEYIFIYSLHHHNIYIRSTTIIYYEWYSSVQLRLSIIFR